MVSLPDCRGSLLASPPDADAGDCCDVESAADRDLESEADWTSPPRRLEKSLPSLEVSARLWDLAPRTGAATGFSGVTLNTGGLSQVQLTLVQQRPGQLGFRKKYINFNILIVLRLGA